MDPIANILPRFIPQLVSEASVGFKSFKQRCLPLIGLLVVVIGLGAGGHKPPEVAFRVNIETAGDGLADTQAVSITLPKTGQTIKVRAISEITERNLRKVELKPDGSTAFTFDHQGRINLDVATGSNQGRYMVVTIDGVVVYSPVIDIQIQDGVLVLPHPLPPIAFNSLKKLADENTKEYHDSVVQ